MTRKDYVRIAAALNYSKPPSNEAVLVAWWVRSVHALADVLQADNPRFNRHRFLVACGFDFSKEAA